MGKKHNHIWSDNYYIYRTYVHNYIITQLILPTIIIQALLGNNVKITNCTVVNVDQVKCLYHIVEDYEQIFRQYLSV